MLVATLCLAVLQDLPPVQAPPQGGGPPAEVGPPAPELQAAAPAPLDFQAPLGPGGILERFQEIAARYPERAVVERLPAEGGSDVALLALGARANGDPAQRPALLLYGWHEPESTSTALAAAEEALSGPPDAPASRLLERATLYLVPVLVPEGVAHDAPLSPARNFPIGWRPDTVVPGAGSVPLASPAARVLATFLKDHGNLSLAVAVGEGPCTGPEDLDLDPGGYRRELGFLRVGELGAEAGLGAAPLCPGTAACFAWAARGVFPAALETPPPLDRMDRALAVLRARALLRAAEGLPRLALGEPALEVLRPGQVRIDVRVENAGRLPTQSCVGAERHLAGPVELTVEGGRVLACAAGAAPDALHVRSASTPGGGCYLLGEIPGGGAVQLSLFVEAAPGSALTLRCSSPRAGRAERGVLVP